MHKNILLLISLSLLGCAKERVDMALDEKGREYKYAEYEYTFELDALLDTVFVLDGSYLEFYPNGNVKMECIYDQGNLTDIKTIHAVDGEVIHLNPLINGTGQVLFLNEKGVKVYESTMKDGYESGLVTKYYDNGQIQSSANKRLSIKHGEEKFYYESGPIQGLRQWHVGKPIDTAYTFYEDGVIASITPYFNHRDSAENLRKVAEVFQDLIGYEHGILKLFHPNGNLERSITFEQGIYAGLTMIFKDDGTIKEKIFYQEHYPNQIRYKVAYNDLGQLIDSTGYEELKGGFNGPN